MATDNSLFLHGHVITSYRCNLLHGNGRIVPIVIIIFFPPTRFQYIDSRSKSKVGYYRKVNPAQITLLLLELVRHRNPKLVRIHNSDYLVLSDL